MFAFLKMCQCCNKKANYCRACSRLFGGYFYDGNLFSNECIGEADIGFYNNLNVDFDFFCIMLATSEGVILRTIKSVHFFMTLNNVGFVCGILFNFY